MIQEYIEINRKIRRITYLTWDASYPTIEYETQMAILNYLEREIAELDRLWPKRLTTKPLTNLKNKIKLKNKDVFAITDKDIQWVEDTIDDYFSTQPISDATIGIIDFLHPAIIKSSYTQFRNDQYRDAVLNAIIAVYELIRKKIRSDKDGSELVCEALSLSSPKLIISNLDTESGKNEQKGYLQILQGAYVGIRNPKAHSLSTDLDKLKAAQYLVFASLLARRIEEAITVDL